MHQLFTYPRQMLINLWVSAESGAPPESINRIRPPRIARTFENTRRFHKSFSRPQAPNQLPFIADSLRAYAKSNNFLESPPFASTWYVRKISALVVETLSQNQVSNKQIYVSIQEIYFLAYTISNTVEYCWDRGHHSWPQNRCIPLGTLFYFAWGISESQRGTISYCASNTSN